MAESTLVTLAKLLYTAMFRNGRFCVAMLGFSVGLLFMTRSTVPGPASSAFFEEVQAPQTPRVAVVTILGDEPGDLNCGRELLRTIRKEGQYTGDLLVIHPRMKLGDGVLHSKFMEVIRESSAIPVAVSADWRFVSQVGQTEERMLRLEMFVNHYFRQWTRLVFIDRNSVVLGPIDSLLYVQLPAGRVIAMPDNHLWRKEPSLYTIEYAEAMQNSAINGAPKARESRVGQVSLMVIDLARMAPPAKLYHRVRESIFAIGSYCLQGDQGIINALWQDQLTTMPTCCPTGGHANSFLCNVSSTSFLEASTMKEEYAMKDMYCKHPGKLHHMVLYDYQQTCKTTQDYTWTMEPKLKDSCLTGAGCLELQVTPKKKKFFEGPMSDIEIEDVLRGHAVDNTVWMAMTDSPREFDPLIDNWICSMNRIGLAPLVWSLDLETHLKVQRKGVLSVFSKDLENPKKAIGQFKKPGSDEYMSVIAMKPKVATKVLNWGFHLLFLDIDLGLNQDPRIWMSQHNAADIQLASNYPQIFLNTGIWLARNTEQTKLLIAEWLRKVVEHKCSGWGCNDQDILTMILVECGWKRPAKEASPEWSGLIDNDSQKLSCSWTGKRALQIEMLPPRYFATGKEPEGEDLVKEAASTGKVVIYHPNFSGFDEGNKEKKLRNMIIDGRTMWCLDKK